jgi:hypothetical protein
MMALRIFKTHTKEITLAPYIGIGLGFTHIHESDDTRESWVIIIPFALWIIERRPERGRSKTGLD